MPRVPVVPYEYGMPRLQKPTKFCVVDGQSVADGTVTVRDRDTLKQERVSADRLREYLRERIEP